MLFIFGDLNIKSILYIKNKIYIINIYTLYIYTKLYIRALTRKLYTYFTFAQVYKNVKINSI